MEEYNGYKNYSTWNVALWIDNDYNLYTLADEFMRTYKGNRPYFAFIKSIGFENEKTPDNIKYISNRLDYKQLNEFMKEFKD